MSTKEETQTQSDTMEACPLPEDVWVVVAAYNEEGRIGRVLDDLARVAQSIVVVDDGSVDRTRDEVLRRPVWLVEHETNLGQGASLQTGIRFALDRGAEFLATFDADGQHRAEDLRAMFHLLEDSQVDFVLGSRFLGRAEGMPMARRLLLRVAVWFTWMFSGIGLSDTHNGIRVMTRRGAERIHLTLNRMEHASELVDQVASSGMRYREAPVTIRYTAESLRKGQKGMDALRLGLKLIWEKVCR